jgi:outer membrane protein TolC
MLSNVRRLVIVGAALVVVADPIAAQYRDTLSLSIADAVELALRAGDEARLASAQVSLTEAQITTARAGGFPQLRFQVTQSHVIENARAQAVGQIFNQPNTYNANANLSFAFFQGGRVRAASRVASRSHEAARLTAEEVRSQVALDVQRAYVQALFAGRVAEIRAAAYTLASERLGQVEQFQAAGRAARYDVLRARVERSNLEPLIVEATSARTLALLELRRLTNIPSDREINLTTVIDPAAVQMLLAGVSDSNAVATRPSVRAAELTAEARRSAVDIARADLWPTLSVALQSGYQAFPRNGFPTTLGRLDPVTCPEGTPDGRTCTAQNGGWFSDRSIATVMTWPLFDGMRARGAIQLAKSQALVAELELAREREQVQIEVAAAGAELQRARSVFGARRENALEANEAFTLASLRFNRGLGTQLEISDAQLALLTAQTDEARSVYDLYLATAEMARALGRPIPFPPVRPVRSSTNPPASLDGDPAIPPH